MIYLIIVTSNNPFLTDRFNGDLTKMGKLLKPVLTPSRMVVMAKKDAKTHLLIFVKFSLNLLR